MKFPTISKVTKLNCGTMVKVEIGGKNILEIPCVDIPERTITSRDGRTTAHLRSSFTDNGRRTSTASRSVTFDWQTVQPRLVITSDTDDFDEELLRNFKDEGFQIRYMPYDGDKAAYQRQLAHLTDPLELGETYAIVGMYKLILIPEFDTLCLLPHKHISSGGDSQAAFSKILQHQSQTINTNT